MTFAPRWQAIARLASWALVAASAVFLVAVARRHWEGISGIALSPSQWLALAGLSVIYGASLLLVAAGWHAVLELAGAGSPGRAHSMRAHSTAQLAKYVPGNVFHLVGRHMIHRRAGMADGPLAKAALAETLLLIAAALTFVAAILIAAMPAALGTWAGLAIAGLAAAACGLVVAVWWLGGGGLSGMVAALLAYLAFFSIMGAIIAAIVAIAGGPFSAGAAGGGVAAWIAGFVTPGAPGGLGIREATMVLIGGDGISAGTLVVAAALLRLVTFCGDLVCFALGRLLFSETQQPRPCEA